MLCRFSSAAFGALALLPLLANADALLHFDPSKGTCQLADRSGEPVLECDASAEPAIELGSTPFVRERSGSHILFRFPDAGGRPLSIEADGKAWRISWPPSNAGTAPPGAANAAVPAPPTTPAPVTPPTAAPPPTPPTPPADVVAEGTAPPAPAEAAAPPAAGPQINAPGAPQATTTTVTTAGAGPADLLGSAIETLVRPFEEEKASDLVFDFSIPESPGFVILGLTPENVTHPRTLRDFVVSLKNGVDESGKLKVGLALDFTPLQLLANEKETLADYLDIEAIMKEMQARRARRTHLFDSPDHILRNTTVSLATTQGTGDSDKSVNLGVGLHIPLIDKSDGREKAEDCFREFFAAPIKSGGVRPELVNPDAANTATSECFSKTRWNDTIWTASLGYAFTSGTGSFSNAAPAARGMWTSFAYGFEGGPPLLRDHAQLILHAKALYKESVTDPAHDQLFIEQDSRVLGFAFKLGSPTFNTSLQASFLRLKDRTHDTHDNLQRLSLGLEYRVKPDLWLVASIGGEGGRAGGENKSFVLGGLKFGSETSPRFAPKP